MKTIPALVSAVLLCISCSAPVHSGFIPVSGGAQLYYEEAGRGEPLILLHGNTLDVRMWDPQFSEFAKHYRTIRFDFRGYGRSSLPEEGRAFTHLDDLLALMDSLRLDRAHIVGLSMGAFVGFDMLGLAPERMLSSVMACGLLKTFKGPSEPEDSVEWVQREAEIAAYRAYGVERKKTEWVESLVAGGGSNAESIRAPLTEMVSGWSAWQELHHMPRVLYAADAAEPFYRNCPDVPVLLIRDMHSKGRPGILKYLPNGDWLRMEDAGHMVNMEQPEAFNSAVLSFLSSR